MSNKTVSVGIDLGHSSVKVAINWPENEGGEKLNMMDTVVKDWRQLSNPDTAKAAEADTVSINGRKFFIGKTAKLQSRAEDFTGQSRDWINTVEHDALILGAWDMVISSLNSHDIFMPNFVLVFGLPASFFAKQKESLRLRVLSLIKPKLGPNQTLEVLVQSQSVAPLFNIAIDANGQPTGKVNDADAWGAVEIGHYTTDFTLLDKGQEIEDVASSTDGVIGVYTRVKEGLKQNDYLHDLETIEIAIREKQIKVFGELISVEAIVNPAINEFASMIRERTNNLFKGSAQRMDGIVIAGGGACIPDVSGAIKAQYKNAFVMENPRYSVATGLCRLGLLSA